jgi:hypothetical protein
MTTTPQRRTRQGATIADALADLDEFKTAQDIHDLLRSRGEDRAGDRVPQSAGDDRRGRGRRGPHCPMGRRPTGLRHRDPRPPPPPDLPLSAGAPSRSSSTASRSSSTPGSPASTASPRSTTPSSCAACAPRARLRADAHLPRRGRGAAHPQAGRGRPHHHAAVAPPRQGAGRRPRRPAHVVASSGRGWSRSATSTCSSRPAARST